MEGKVKVSSVQMHVVDNDLEANMKKAEEMAMRIHDWEKDVDLILYHECCLEGGIPLDSIDEDITRRVMEFWSNLAKKCGIQQPALARIETFKIIPKINTLIKIAECVNISIEALNEQQKSNILKVSQLASVVMNLSYATGNNGGYIYNYGNN